MSVNSKRSLEIDDGALPLPDEFGIESQIDLIIHLTEDDGIDDDHMGLVADVDREELQVELKKLVWGSLHSRYLFWVLGLLQLICGMQMNLNPYINIQPPRFPVCGDERRLTTLSGGLAPIPIANAFAIQPIDLNPPTGECDPFKRLNEYDCTTEYMYYFDGTSVVESFNIPSDKCELNPLFNVWLTKNSLFIGFAIGAWLVGIAMDRIGRKKVVTLSLLLYLILCPTAVLAPNMYIFALLRFLTGICMSGMSIGSLILICELTNRRNRRKVMAMYVLTFGFGAMLTAFIGSVLMDWKMLICITTTPGYLLLLWQSCVKFNVESPRFYLARGEDVVAMDIYRSIADYNGHGLQEKMSNINENNIREFVDALFDDIDEEIDDLTPRQDLPDELNYSPKSDNFLFTPKIYSVSTSNLDPDKWYQILFAWPCSIWMWASMFLYFTVESLSQGVNIDLVSYESAYLYFAKTTGVDPDAYLFIGGTDIVPVDNEEDLLDEFKVVEAIHNLEGDTSEGDLFGIQGGGDQIGENYFYKPKFYDDGGVRRLQATLPYFKPKMRGNNMAPNGVPDNNFAPPVGKAFNRNNLARNDFELVPEVEIPYSNDFDQIQEMKTNMDENYGVTSELRELPPMPAEMQIGQDFRKLPQPPQQFQEPLSVEPDSIDKAADDSDFININEDIDDSIFDEDFDSSKDFDSQKDFDHPDNVETESWQHKLNDHVKWMRSEAMNTYETKVAEMKDYAQEFVSGAFEKLKKILDPNHPLAEHYGLIRRYSWALISVTMMELVFQMFAVWFCGWNVLGRKAVVAGWCVTSGILLICCGLLRLPFAIAQVPVLYYGRFLHFLEIFSRFLIVGAITVLQLYIFELFPTSVAGSTYGLITMVIGIIPLSAPVLYSVINSILPGGYMMVFGGLSIFASMVLIATTPDTLTRPTFSTLKHLRSTAEDDPYLNSAMAPCRYCCYDLAYKLCCCCFKNNEHTAIYRELMSKKKLKRMALLMVLEGKKEMKDVYKKTRREISKLIKSPRNQPDEAERNRID